MVLVKYDMKPKKVFSYLSRLCEVQAEAEETVEHRAYNTT